MTLPTDAAERKTIPLARGLLDYFPAALAEVAKLSQRGNEQHIPGKPLGWDRSKSGDEADALLRHLIERGTIDTDGVRHSAKVAWRALAMLQKELEETGVPIARGVVIRDSQTANTPKWSPEWAMRQDLREIREKLDGHPVAAELIRFEDTHWPEGKD